MKKVIAKLSKEELNQMIAEEYAKMKKVIALKKQKDALQAEIKQLKESYGLDEVEVAGHKDKGDAYYEKGLPVQKFEKKGTHLKEDDDLDGMDADMSTGVEAEESCGEVEAMLRDIGRKIDQLLDGQDELEADHEEIGADSAGDADEIDMDDDGAEYEETDDSAEEVEEVEEVEEEVEEGSDETIEEQDGETVVNAAKQDTVNDNMKKVDNKNPMADKMYEGKRVGKKHNSQHARLNPDNNPLINEELERMRRLANLL